MSILREPAFVELDQIEISFNIFATSSS